MTFLEDPIVAARISKLQEIGKEAASKALIPLGTEDAFGAADGHVEGVGFVKIECRKEWVERRRGAKVRRRYRFFLEGRRVTERSLYLVVRRINERPRTSGKAP